MSRSIIFCSIFAIFLTIQIPNVEGCISFYPGASFIESSLLFLQGFGCPCGDSPGAIDRIVSGEKAEIINYPYIAQLVNASGNVRCGMTIITNYELVTAAHCFEDVQYKTFKVKASAQTRQSDSGTFYEIEDVFVHESFNSSTVDPFFHDIAIVRVKKPIMFTNTQQPACLPATSDYDGKTSTILGWGQTFFGQTAPNDLQLQKAEVTAYNSTNCKVKTIYTKKEERFIDGVLCGLSEGDDPPRDSCKGDSGGPLAVYNSNKKAVLTGIVSYGEMCASPGLGGIYTDVFHYRNWILEKIKQNEQIRCKN